MTDAHKEPKVAIERHAQTIGIGLITLALAWSASTMRQIYDAQIAQSIAINNIKNSMIDLQTDIKDVRDQLAKVPTNREIDARFDSVTRRLDTLEKSNVGHLHSR